MKLEVAMEKPFSGIVGSDPHDGIAILIEHHCVFLNESLRYFCQSRKIVSTHAFVLPSCIVPLKTMLTYKYGSSAKTDAANNLNTSFINFVTLNIISIDVLDQLTCNKTIGLYSGHNVEINKSHLIFCIIRLREKISESDWSGGVQLIVNSALKKCEN